MAKERRKTIAAVVEMVQVAFEKYGGRGDAEAVVIQLRMDDKLEPIRGKQ